MRKIILALLLVTAFQCMCFAEYTGLIIDARSFGIMPGMCPKIYDTTKNEIYGTVDTDVNIVSEQGLVDYAENVEEAIETCTVGKDPLIIKAIGNGKDPLKINIIITKNDAEKIIEANGNNSFLEDRKIAVIL